ncbi:hypothetical protein HK097_000925 [Rhizophlyctis rosea]|uniref:Uncharacterized protein n=1 Tax=Rhizophlyctis rosea TaxID=64517 RepID=A0AAD5X3L2_9FUNG|nr:hypothetical protein HK097_000925 [Rhizophlyctis rosea]
MHTHDESEDPDENVDESDLIESEMAFNPALMELEQRRERARRERAGALVDRWRKTAWRAGIWMQYINQLRSDAQQRKTKKSTTRKVPSKAPSPLPARSRKPSAGGIPHTWPEPVPEPSPVASAVSAPKDRVSRWNGPEKTVQSLLIEGSGQNSHLTPFGALLKAIVGKTNNVLGIPQVGIPQEADIPIKSKTQPY